MLSSSNNLLELSTWNSTSRKRYEKLRTVRHIPSQIGPTRMFLMLPLAYTIWHGQEFIYVGMSGRGLAEADITQKRVAGEKKTALFSRLESHASGRRSGDQFCLYICDHFVVPELTSTELNQVHDGSISLDERTKRFIRAQLNYRFVEVSTGQIALKVEAHLKRVGVNGNKHRLNPA